jgi:hypothetical protein
MRVFKAIAGCILFVIGVFAALVTIHAILDPVGAKMSDDADPFGTPPSRVSSLFMLLLWLVVSGIGTWLLHRCNIEENRNGNNGEERDPPSM